MSYLNGGSNGKSIKINDPAQSILLKALAPDDERTGARARFTTEERLLHCVACDYGTHALVLETVIEALIRKGVITEDEFESLLREIDSRDGKIDGTLGTPTYLGDGI